MLIHKKQDLSYDHTKIVTKFLKPKRYGFVFRKLKKKKSNSFKLLKN